MTSSADRSRDQRIDGSFPEKGGDKKRRVSVMSLGDDVINDMSLHQTPTGTVTDNCIVTPDGRIIPEHERTQEIDIDALLCLSDTPEETEEDLENEEEFV